MPPEPASSAPGAQLVQFIIFKLADEDFAIPIGEIREIIRSTAVTPVPGSSQAVKGMINVRGEIAVVVDLKIRFGLRGKNEAQPKHIIITAQKKNLFAFMVDEVTEILRIMADEIKPTPDIGVKIEESYVTGIVMREGRLIVLLDLVKVLSEPVLAGPS